MPVTTESGDVVIDDRLEAAGTFGGEQLEEVLAAVGTAGLFMVTIVAKVLSTMSAEEMLGMPGLVEGGDASLYTNGRLVGTRNISMLELTSTMPLLQ